ncbi:MAG TPA: two-component regulator propeller domain-containing protein, partial [Rhodothermia bacterium]
MRKPGTWYLELGTILTSFIIHYSLLITPASAQALRQDEVPSPVSSRPLPIRFENLSLEDGLSMSVGQSIFQDRYGFIWIGTQQGVNRYDGYEFKLYTNEPFNPNSFPEGWVLDIDEDAEGNLWFATESRVSRMNRVDESFTHWRHDPDDERSIGDAWVVFPDKHGLVWIAGAQGLDVLDPKSNVVAHFRHDSTDQSSISSGGVRDIMLDASGMMWISTGSGLNRIDPVARDGFTRFLSERVLTAFERPAEPGLIWAAGLDDLIRLDPGTGDVHRYPYPGGRMQAGFGGATRIVQDPVNRNVLWMNQFAEGLLRFDLRNGRFIQYKADPDDPTSLSNDRTMTLYGDRSGTIWVGTVGNGVDRFNPGSADMEHVRSGAKSEKGLPAALVWGVSTGPDGYLWVTTMDESGRGRLSRIDRETGSARHYAHDPNEPRSLTSGGLLKVQHDGAGTLWVGGGGDWPLSRYDPATNSFYHVVADPNSPNGIVNDQVERMFVDSQGELWVGTEAGLSRIDPYTGRIRNYPAGTGDTGIPANGIIAIAEDQSGTLWLGFWSEGLMAFDPVTGRTERFVHDPNDTTSICTNAISSLLVRARAPSILWLGTSVGLNRFDIDTGKSRRFGIEDGLPDNVIYEMLEDDAGRIWMSTNRGLSRFDPETETFRNYGTEVGLQALEFSLFASHKSATGELFFGGINGLNAFYPNQLIENITPPEVALVDLRLHNESISKSKAVALEAPLPATSEISLDYTQKDISFDFAALHFENPEKNTFAYKLEGYDDDWVMTGHDRTAAFTNLSPGKYVFRVKAANSDGVWNEAGTAITIVIAPPFWATWWFRLLAILGFGGFLYAGYTLRVRQIAERNRLLEAEVGKRTAELNESKQRLETTNEQLEKSHVIVEAINQETSFRRLLTKILEQSRVIPGVEKATALVRLEDDLFHVRASSGWDVGDMQHIKLTSKQAHQRYVEQADEVSKNIFVAKNVAERAGKEEMAEFGKVASFLVLRVMVEGDVRAYLVFDNLTDPDAFDQRDVALLERIREHIQSAFIKTSILEDLQETLNNLRATQDRLIQSEKMASLGQLTAGIAHEIKNPLNFVNNFAGLSVELLNELKAAAGPAIAG